MTISRVPKRTSSDDILTRSAASVCKKSRETRWEEMLHHYIESVDSSECVDTFHIYRYHFLSTRTINQAAVSRSWLDNVPNFIHVAVKLVCFWDGGMPTFFFIYLFKAKWVGRSQLETRTDNEKCTLFLNAVTFSNCPWLQEGVNGLLSNLIAKLQNNLVNLQAIVMTKTNKLLGRRINYSPKSRYF